MTAEDLYKYVAVVLTIIGLSNIVLLFFYLFKYFNRKNNATVSINNDATNSFEGIMKDLDYIVQRKCSTAYRRALKPFVNKALKNKPLINDDIVNKVSLQITKEILEEMSETYREKLESIYKSDRINDIILELVYNTVTEMAMSINKTSINKMKFANNLGTISSTDFDID